MSTDDEIHARQSEITGHPPRIAAQHTDDVLAAARAQLAKIAGVGSGKPMDLEQVPVPEMLLTVMCHRELFARLADVSVFLLQQPSLPKRDRQLMILRTAWLLGIPYIWGEHVKVSRNLGLSSEDIEQATVGSGSDHWDAHERALLRAVEELRANAMISDATWAVLAERYDEQQLFELPVLVGQFSTVGYFQNALRIPLSRGNAGLAAR
ncbi:carboxymuconolactone decarboxylase family protein [Haliea sp. E17]|uniref:carboxymuconolactone decarboxylase family protein n=1 Tax=Haliea sp. E17 TaxID=3401576 RepID=UPI003AB0ED95